MLKIQLKKSKLKEICRKEKTQRGDIIQRMTIKSNNYFFIKKIALL